SRPRRSTLEQRLHGLRRRLLGSGPGGELRCQCIRPSRCRRQRQRVGGGLLARRLPPRARGRRRLGQSRMPPAGDARRRLGQRTGADALGVARAGGRRHHQRTAWLPGGARPLAPDRKKERRMRQDPLGNGQQGARRRRGGGLRWWVLILFAGYAAWYWFSNRSTDPYTGETVLIDESITPQDEKAL